MSCLSLVRIWLVLSVLASLVGWGLSAVGQLNRVGYAVVFTASAGLLWWGRKRLGLTAERAGGWGKLVRRCGRPLPLCFVVLACLVFAGGVLYPPSNHTAFTYRIPRVLHWLAEGRWHWIHTNDYRLNDRACGIEWLTAPLLLFTRSDRTLFLLNFVPYLLLPGLLFSVFGRLGVQRRVAWHWMWLLPTGYTFLLQAGSAGNDTFPTVYALAALDFGLRAWQSRRASDLGYSFVAAALLTGAKASNLPLLLPWAIVVTPVMLLLLRRPGLTAVLAVVCLLVSFLPTAVLNVAYCGDWSGLNLERAGMDLRNPWVGLWGNAFLMLLNNLVPPFFPGAAWWNASGLSVLPQGMAHALVANFENGFDQLKELQTEDWAGLGFGLCLFIGISFCAALVIRRRLVCLQPSADKTGCGPRLVDGVPVLVRWGVLLGAWGSLLAFCLKSGMSNGARLISPYYPLLLPLLVVGAGQAALVRRRWWRRLAAGTVGLAAIVLIVTPGRPLWPAETVLTKAMTAYPGRRLFARAFSVYAVYAERSDPLAKVRALLPPDVGVVGFLGDADDIDISLWRPYFARRVRHVLLEDGAAEIQRRQIQYIVVGGAFLEFRRTTLARWQEQVGAELVATTTATLKVAQGPQPWYLVRMPATGKGRAGGR